MNILDRLFANNNKKYTMDNLGTGEETEESVDKSNIRILKFLDNTDVNMTILSSIILLAIFFVETTLTLTSHEFVQLGCGRC